MLVIVEAPTHNILISLGYKLVEDAWENSGRRTYSHDDDVSRTEMANLKINLGSAGWIRDTNALWIFRQQESGEILEVEPGGAETSGHFLHHLK